jgi:hypothetical protein
MPTVKNNSQKIAMPIPVAIWAIRSRHVPSVGRVAQHSAYGTLQNPCADPGSMLCSIRPDAEGPHGSPTARDPTMTSATLETAGRLRTCLFMFGLTYLVLSVLVTAVLVIFDIQGNGGVATGVLVAATAIAVRTFVIDHQRALRRGEQLRFALLALGSVALITLLQGAVAVPMIIKRSELPALIPEVQAWIAANTSMLAFVIAVVVLVYFAILYFTSGWLSRLFATRLAATGRI